MHFFPARSGLLLSACKCAAYVKRVRLACLLSPVPCVAVWGQICGDTGEHTPMCHELPRFSRRTSQLVLAPNLYSGGRLYVILGHASPRVQGCRGRRPIEPV